MKKEIKFDSSGIKNILIKVLIFILFVFVIVFFGRLTSIILGNTDEEKTENQNKVNNITTPKLETQKEIIDDTQKSPEISSAFKLASLEIGHNSPPQYLVDKFENILKSLNKKCPNETEDQIAEYVFKGKKMINDKGIAISFEEVLDGMDDSFPEYLSGSMKCSEVASMFVVLTNN